MIDFEKEKDFYILQTDHSFFYDLSLREYDHTFLEKVKVTFPNKKVTFIPTQENYILDTTNFYIAFSNYKGVNSEDKAIAIFKGTEKTWEPTISIDTSLHFVEYRNWCDFDFSHMMRLKKTQNNRR